MYSESAEREVTVSLAHWPRRSVNWIGCCRESLAFTCTIDKVLEPGASALITMLTIVPVPVAHAVIVSLSFRCERF